MWLWRSSKTSTEGARRGDTTFAGYITERQRAGVEEALRYCTALVSLKMETPGPFQGTRQDVLDYLKEFY